MNTKVTSYGFRVYSVELRMGPQLAAKPWLLPTGVHYGSYASSVVGKLCDDGQLLNARIKFRDIPTWSSAPATSADPDDRVIRWIGRRQDGLRLSVEVKYGTVGSFTDALGPGGDTSIADKAPGRLYRAIMLLPPHDGPGLLAVECISRVAPITPVINWLSAGSFLHETELASGGDIGASWWRLRAEQVSDSRFLENLIEEAKEAEIVLKQKTVDGANNRLRTKFRLQAPLLSGDQRSSAVDWVRKRLRLEADFDGMLEIVGLQHTGDLQFNDGDIVLDDGETKTKVGLNDVGELFTYHIGDARPSDSEWEASVQQRFGLIDEGLQWD